MFDGKYFDWNQKRVKGIVDYYGYKFFYGKKMADLGCGHADISGVIYRLGSDVTAVDARQEHLKVVSKKFPGIKTVKGNLDGPWPFHGQKFDITLDLGLLCHLASFENHLRAVCASTTYLVLETAVCDSDDPNKCVQVPEAKEVYDLSYNGMGCRPSVAAIERVLIDCHMSFKRMDSTKFNSGDYIYDWYPKNDGSHSISKRRIWFCTKNPPGVYLPESAGQPVVVVQPIEPTSQYVHFTGTTGTPLVLTNGPQIPPPPAPYVGTASPKPPMAANMIFQRDMSTDDIKKSSQKYALLPGVPKPQFPHLKVLYLPLGDQPGMVDAFNELGIEVKVYDFYSLWEATHNKGKIEQTFIQYVRDFKPNLIHMQLQFTGLIDVNVIAEARRLCPGVIITNWTGDVRSNAQSPFTSLASAVDYSLISSTGQLRMYRDSGCHNVRYWQIGFNPKVNFPMHLTEFKYDLSFIGNNYGGTFPDGHLRMVAANQIRTQIGDKFGLFGNGYSPHAPSCAPSESNGIYNQSLCTLSISNFNSVAHYFSDRLLHCLASGRPTISWNFPGFDSYFTEGKDIFIARSNRDIMDIVNKCKQDPGMAKMVGLNGYQRVLEEHTFTSRALELLDIAKLINIG